MVIVFISGGLGCSVRYVISVYMTHIDRGFPLAIVLVNLMGAMFAGIVMGAITSAKITNPAISLALTVGFLGGFTTFSAFTLEFYQLSEKPIISILYLLTTIVGGITLFYCGAWLSQYGLSQYGLSQHD